MSSDGDVRTQDLAADMRGQAAEVLALAFKDEEATRYHLDPDRPAVLRRILRLEDAFLQLYLDAGRPVLAVLEGGRVVGVGVIRDPRIRLDKMRAASLVLRRTPTFVALFAPHPVRAMRIKSAWRHPKGMAEPYLTFEVLGVHPDHQGRGIGRSLMGEAQAMATRDAALSGIYLNTASARNQAFYQSLGYQTLKIKDLGEVKIYHMFWPNPAFR